VTALAALDYSRAELIEAGRKRYAPGQDRPPPGKMPMIDGIQAAAALLAQALCRPERRRA